MTNDLKKNLEEAVNESLNLNRVFVYRNLHKKCLSVKDVKTGRVIAHVESIVLEKCKLKVSQAGRLRVLREKRKNVHAGVEGFWVKNAPIPDLSKKTQLIYDPYKFESFVEKSTLKKRHQCETAIVTSQGVFV